MQSKNVNDFWKGKENRKLSLQSNIDAVSGSDNIGKLWRRQSYELFNGVKRNVFIMDKREKNANECYSTRSTISSYRIKSQ